MENAVIDKRPSIHIKEKISRFKPIIFLKKYLLLFIFVLFVILSTIFGLWNIKGYEVTNLSGEDIEDNLNKSISSYIENNVIGKNYFLLKLNSIEDSMISEISYLEDVDITKILPNKIELLIKVYDPELVAILREDKCYLLSEEGAVLEHLCEEETVGCCTDYAQNNEFYILTAGLFDISSLENGKEKLLYMDNISKVIKVVKTLDYGISKISVTEELIDVTISGNRLLRFSFNQEIDLQLSRLLVVAGKIQSDDISFKSLDLRFERPVMKK
ncbi:MAG: hypothetical protein PHE21_00705 [Candidatus Dojkabacteria bacterium]|nr:hypothetical protein [Candidatus Dojkabacteria bacterium]